MTWLVDDGGEWTVLDALSLDTSVSFSLDGARIDALQNAGYREFRRHMMAIGSEAVVRVLVEAYREPFDGFDAIESADDDALAEIADLYLAAVHLFIRTGFVLRDGWIDRLEMDTRQWLKHRERTPEKNLGREAFRVIADCRQRFGLGWRGTGGGLKKISAAH